MFLESLEERAVPNGAPLAVDDGPFTVLHGQTLNNIAILANDSDPDNDPLSVEIQQHPSHGYAYFDSYTGTAIYMPFLNYAGSDSFTYKLWDGQAYSNIATVTIDVTNNPPEVANLGPYTVLEGQSLIGLDLLGNATDADGDDLTVFIQQFPSHGYLYQDYYTGTWTYTANEYYLGPDLFSYQVFDGAGYSSLATVTIDILNPYATYLEAVAAANASFNAAVALAANNYQGTTNLAVSEAQSQAEDVYIIYKNQVLTDYQIYFAYQTSAYTAYESEVNPAYTTATAAVEAAYGNYINALISAQNDFQTAIIAAEEVYQNAIQAADNAYLEAVDPLQQARDNAYANYLANPEDPEAQAVYEQAEQDLTNAIALALPVRDFAYAAALSAYENEENQAGLNLDAVALAAESEYATEVNAAQQAFFSAEESAWNSYTFAESAAWIDFIAAEDSAWNSYANSLGLIQSNLAFAFGEAEGLFQANTHSAFLAWELTETTAWNTYLSAIGNSTPEGRINPPEQPSTPSNPVLPELTSAPRDPEALVAMAAIPEIITRQGQIQSLENEISILRNFITDLETEIVVRTLGINLIINQQLATGIINLNQARAIRLARYRGEILPMLNQIEQFLLQILLLERRLNVLRLR